MNNRIIVTGSGGMLGSALVDKLLENGKTEVIAVTSQTEKLSSRYAHYDNIQIVSSIYDIEGTDSSICVHCAFPRTQNGYVLSQAITDTENVISHLASINCRHFINISSQSVYSQSDNSSPDEAAAVSPSNLYGITKYAIEQIVRIVCTNENIDYTNIRLASLIDEKFDQRMINRFYDKAQKDEIIRIDKGIQKISYLHVEDAVSALEMLVDRIIGSHKVDDLYNLGNNDWMALSDLAEKCRLKAKELNIGDLTIEYNESVSSYSNLIDSSKFYTGFIWSPEYSMTELIDCIFQEKLLRQE